MDGGVSIAKMMDKTNLLVLVCSSDNPFKSQAPIILWDDVKKESTLGIDLKNPIRNVLIDNGKILVVLDKKLFIMNFDGNTEATKATYSNPYGICVLNQDKDNKIMITLGVTKGEIEVWKLNKDSSKKIKAHNNNIERIAVNKEGTLVATCSETGTLINIFNTTTGKKLNELRRGSLSTKIHDLAFNTDSSCLACCSGNGTIHIFDLNNCENKNSVSVLSSCKDYLPVYFSSQWSYRQHFIGTNDKMICGFGIDNVLHVVTYKGVYYSISGKDYVDIKSTNLHINNK